MLKKSAFITHRSLLVEKNERATKRLLFLGGGLLGFLVFLAIYGVNILNVQYDQWLLQSGDMTQHYLGWRAFRQSSWDFPLGMMNQLSYPFKTSVMYTDSIPVFALLFKLISPMLPATFQYFGIWGAMCFFLQGGIASLLIHSVTRLRLWAIAPAIFFIISTTVLKRLYVHTALAAHWIILLAFYLYFLANDSSKPYRKSLLHWLCLIALCPWVHTYFLLMIVLIYQGFLLQYLLRERFVWRRFFMVIGMEISGALVALTSMYILGAFQSDTSNLATVGYGYYSANINTLINPAGASAFLKDKPFATKGQGEGFAYLGLGILCLLLIDGYKELQQFADTGKKTSIRSWFTCKHIDTWLPPMLILIIFFVFSLSSEITYNDKILFSIPLSETVFSLLSVFRASGRLIWPVQYAVMLTSVSLLCHAALKPKGRKAATFLACTLCITLQIADISPFIRQTHERFVSDSAHYTDPLQSPAWDILAQGHELVAVMSENVYTLEASETLYTITPWALNHNIPLTNFYLARPDKNAIESARATRLYLLQNDRPDPHALYLFDNSEAVAEQNYPLSIYEIDGLCVGTVNRLPSESLSSTDRVIQLR